MTDFQVQESELARIVAERDRYREALEEIAKWKGSDAYGDLSARKAREALDG